MHYCGVFAKYCIKCQGVLPNIPDFKKYSNVAQVAKVDEGASIKQLTRLSRIHLFGISFIFFFAGLISRRQMWVWPFMRKRVEGFSWVRAIPKH